MHTVMTLPTGKMVCLGPDHVAAIARASRSFALTGAIMLDKVRVESNAWNASHEATFRCDGIDCVGTREDAEAQAALDAAIEANAAVVGIPNDDPEEAMYHEEGCMNMSCAGCAQGVLV